MGEEQLTNKNIVIKNYPLVDLLLSREKLWFNQMADEDKRKVEMETQQVVNITIFSLLISIFALLTSIIALLTGIIALLTSITAQ